MLSTSVTDSLGGDTRTYAMTVDPSVIAKLSMEPGAPTSRSHTSSCLSAASRHSCASNP